MHALTGEIVGDIHIVVCKTPDGQNFFQIKADNENILPVIDVLEDTLIHY